MFVIQLTGPHEAEASLLDRLTILIVVGDPQTHSHATRHTAGAPRSRLLLARFGNPGIPCKGNVQMNSVSRNGHWFLSFSSVRGRLAVLKFHYRGFSDPQRR